MTDYDRNRRPRQSSSYGEGSRKSSPYDQDSRSRGARAQGSRSRAARSQSMHSQGVRSQDERRSSASGARPRPGYGSPSSSQQRSRQRPPASNAQRYSRDAYHARSAGSAPRAARSASGSSPRPNAYANANRGSHAARRRGASHADAGSYTLSTGNMAAMQKHGNRKPLIIAAAIAVVVLAALIWFFVIPHNYNVSVNGTTVSVPANSTLQDIVDEGYASPVPGNLIAVDGSVAEQGGGNVLKATINGEQTSDAQARVSKDAVIVIEDGEDATEPYSETVKPVAYATSDTTATPESYYFGSVHLYSQGVDGEQSVRTGEVSGKTATVVTKQPVDSGFTAYSPNVGDDKVIALTFDDGPWPETSGQILEILEENGALATFFVIGEQCKDNATVLKNIAAAGNQIATHTYDHADGSGQGVNLTYMSADEQVSEVTKGFDAIKEVIGSEVSPILRAPGGNYYGSLVETLAPYVDAEVGWDVDTLDWSKPGVDKIVERIMSVQPGQIVLMHDGGGDRSQTVEALRIALPQLVAQGYRFVTVDELLAYGVPAE